MHAPLTQYVRACALHWACWSEREGERAIERIEITYCAADSRGAIEYEQGHRWDTNTPCTAAAGATFRLIYHSTRSSAVCVIARDVCVKA